MIPDICSLYLQFRNDTRTLESVFVYMYVYARLFVKSRCKKFRRFYNKIPDNQLQRMYLYVLRTPVHYFRKFFRSNLHVGTKYGNQTRVLYRIVRLYISQGEQILSFQSRPLFRRVIKKFWRVISLYCLSTPLILNLILNLSLFAHATGLCCCFAHIKSILALQSSVTSICFINYQSSFESSVPETTVPRFTLSIRATNRLLCLS